MARENKSRTPRIGICKLVRPRDHDIAHVGQRIGRLLRRASAENNCRTAARDAMGRLLHAIRDRFLDPTIKVNMLLRELHIDRNHLHPHFHATLGTTPWKYICARRFDVARILLRDTHLDIWKVSALVGYHDPRTFGRAFKNAIGRTPSATARTLKRYRPADQPFP